MNLKTIAKKLEMEKIVNAIKGNDIEAIKKLNAFTKYKKVRDITKQIIEANKKSSQKEEEVEGIE